MMAIFTIHRHRHYRLVYYFPPSTSYPCNGVWPVSDGGCVESWVLSTEPVVCQPRSRSQEMFQSWSDLAPVAPQPRAEAGQGRAADNQWFCWRLIQCFDNLGILCIFLNYDSYEILLYEKVMKNSARLCAGKQVGSPSLNFCQPNRELSCVLSSSQCIPGFHHDSS